MFTPDDIKTLKDKGISEDTVLSQIHRFKTGFPFLTIASSAHIDKGIKKLSVDEEDKAIERWSRYIACGGSVCKFVPASGAASRMFKALFAFIEGESDTPAQGSPVFELLAHIHDVAFFEELNVVVKKLYSKDVDSLLAERRYKDVVSAIIGKNGLNYGNLPKGLLSFHAYGDYVRTPIEEQFVEGAQSAAEADGTVRLHFTVSTEHKALFEKKFAEIIPKLEQSLGVKFDVSMSEQKPSTDTVAVTPDNVLFRENGHLVFRPGGHGALIANLNDIESPVVFIKNIDNVVPDSQRDTTLRYKRVLAGYLMEVHDVIEAYIHKINAGNYTIDDVREMIAFLHNELNVRDKQMKTLEDVDLVLYIKKKLNRPLRICGMVRNEGEPGGGPYITYAADGSTSPQILESHQIDMSNPDYRAMVSDATHFNPVDLVCYIKDVDGKHYDLLSFVDSNTGFISEKSLHGKELRALELPGLWNGAMSDWNTVFVEVPIATFNPVKTVNDLLRPAHRQ